MKRIIAILGVGITLATSGIFASTTTLAAEVEAPRTEEKLILADPIETEDHETVTGPQTRWGWRWYCSKCDYESAWHGTYDSAASRAYQHEQRYGCYGYTGVRGA